MENKYKQAMKDLELWYQPTTEPQQRKQAIKSLAVVFALLRKASDDYEKEN